MIVSVGVSFLTKMKTQFWSVSSPVEEPCQMAGMSNVNERRLEVERARRICKRCLAYRRSELGYGRYARYYGCDIARVFIERVDNL